MLRVDAVQHRLAARVTEWIQGASNLPLKIGSVRVKHLNKIEISDILLNDLEGDTLACIEKITAHVSPLHLLRNRIRVNSIMLASPTFRIRRVDSQTPTNAQFLFDLLAGNDTTPSSAMPNIRINQLHMYDGRFSYHVGEIPALKSDRFSPQHIEIDNISANISLKELSEDTLRLHVRNLSGRESSGVQLKNLKMRFRASERGLSITKMKMGFPDGEINSDRITVRYSTDKNSGKKRVIFYEGDIYSKGLSLHDFSALSPQFTDSLPKIVFTIRANGQNESINLETLTIETDDKNILLDATANIQEFSEKQPLHEIEIKKAHITRHGTEILQSLFQGDSAIFDILKRAGDITLTGNENGEGKNAIGNISLKTECGKIDANVTISERTFTCNLQGKRIDIGALAAEKSLGRCDITSQIKGIIGNNDSSSYNATILSTINNLEFNRYTYSPIEFEGFLEKNTARGVMRIQDNNLSAKIYAGMNSSKEYPEYDLRIEVDSMNLLPLNLSKEKKDSQISFKLVADYMGNKSDKSLLTANLYDFELHNPDKYWKIRRFNVTDNSQNNKRTLLISSDVLNSYIHGYYDYKTLGNSLSDIIHRHIPSFEPAGDTTGNNRFVFNIDISNSEILSSLLDLPFTIHSPSSINGSCNDSIKQASITGDFKDIDILDRRYESIITKINSDKAQLQHNTQMTYSDYLSDKNVDKNKDNVIIKINSTAKNDTLKNAITWEGAETGEKRGDVGFEIYFGHIYDKVNFNAMIHPGTITYGDSIWDISESQIQSYNDKYHIHNFKISNGKHKLCIDGVIGTDDNDSLKVNLDDIQLEDVMDIVNFHSVDFGGRATGNINLSRLLSEPAFSSRLEIEEFKFEKGNMGRMSFKGDWEEESKSIILHGRIENGLNTTIANGIVSPSRDTIDIRVRANGARIEFLNYMLSSALSDVDGEVNGELSVRGRMRDINLYGALSPTGTLRLKPTNTVYSLKGDTVVFTRNRISFNNFEINDKNGNKGFVNGVVSHNSISRFGCSFDITADNLLAYDTHSFGDDGFYGTAFVTGNAKFRIDNAGIRLNAEVSPESNSRFVYNAAGPEGATSNDFVTFIDRQARKHETIRTHKEQQDSEAQDFSSKLHFDFMINTTPGLQLRVYTNTVTGDYIDIYGNGPINAIYDEKEGFNMKGNLSLTRGTYKFTLQDIFPKEFSIKPGSTLAFNGDPFLANLNLNTVYTVASAPLTDLSLTAERRKTVKVNCLMDITGTLQNPTLTFGLELPDGNEEEKELLASATSTPEQTNMQFIYLIGIGKFYTYDYNNQNNTSQSSTAMESLISSTISGQLNNMLSQITDSDNWNISGNFTTSERGWNSMEVEGMLSGRLLDNRLLINGNFGYRDNPLANKNFIGDFEVQWLLNNNGNVSLKAYSKTNDRYFSKTTLTTQGAGIMLRHDFNSWLFLERHQEEEPYRQINIIK